ncbi:kinase-like domain-containing protein, partial [Mycena floridula]
MSGTSQRRAKEFPNLVGTTLDYGRYELLEVLGAGTYGKVYKATDNLAPGNPFVAIKCLEQYPPGSRQAQAQNREFSLHKRVHNHPNIITFLRHFSNGNFVFAVLQLCTEGDLFHAIITKSFANDDERVKSSMVQIIDALQYAHDSNVFHRDLKPHNILLSSDGRVYLADFGLSTEKPLSMDFGCGSPFYMSPECWSKEAAFSTAQGDIWAVGVVLANILSGRHPWTLATPSDPFFATYMQDPDYLLKVLPISEAANKILCGVLCRNPANRTSLQALRKQILDVETFFKDDDWESSAN